MAAVDETRETGSDGDPRATTPGGGAARSQVSPWEAVRRGIADALDVVTPVQSMYSVPEIWKNVKDCAVLNGVIFMGSLLLFHFGVRPLIQLVFSQTITASGSSFALKYSWFAELLVEMTYNLAWVLPIFILSKVLNVLYHQNIANHAYAYLCGGKPPKQQEQNRDANAVISLMVADLVFSSILQIIFIVEITIVGFIPLIGTPLSFILTCFLSSLYSFETRWLKDGWDFRKRFTYLERRWPYFLGFGLPFTTGVFFLSFLHSSAAFALLFPVFIIIATKASPVLASSSLIFPESIPVFTPSRQITNLLITKLKFRGDAEQK